MSEALRLFGTKSPPTPSERIVLGDLSFTLEDGGLRHIRYKGAEMIRAIAFVVRDRDWGTLAPSLTVLSQDIGPDSASLHLEALFETPDAALHTTLVVQATQSSLRFRADSVAHGAFETNRTGFSVLHPAGLAGCPVSVTHSDGAVEAAHFPTLIDPWQPFMDIVSMTHHADGLAVCCAFEGDTFEMEDQRQWGDASYKTYVRPLALPWPYLLEDNQPFSQSVTITWQDADTRQTAAQDSFMPGTVRFPETALLVSAQDAERLAQNPLDLEDVAPQRLLCHLDTSQDGISAHLDAFAKLQSVMPGPVYDLELVCAFADPPAVELRKIRAAMDAAGFTPQSVLVCPAVDRQSTPPGSDWPPCPPLEQIHTASAAVFGDLLRGGGMVSFFPELNRKRPPVEMLDFVSHALCPIVHAADDLSVMETLEAIPHITRTARSFIGTAAYRIGPATIAMRHNPYGQRTIPNPSLGRVCMADTDPRHAAQFAAAYAIGLACALAPSGIAVWTPSELYGPRGLSGPLRDAVSVLASCANAPVHQARIIDGRAELVVGTRRIVANLTPQDTHDLGSYQVKVSDAQA